MEIISTAFFFLLGISTGSFLNVVADRVPLGQSIIKPPSHCFNCGHVLYWKDMVPVLSYLILRGRCRYCRAKISSRSVLVEIITGLLFVFAYIRFGFSLQTVVILLFASVLIIIIVTRWEGMEMPDLFIYAGIVIALALKLLSHGDGIVSDFLFAIGGMACGFVILLLNWLIQKFGMRRNIGFQSVLNGGLAGTMTGFPAVLIALLIAASIGLLFFGIHCALKRYRVFPGSADIWLSMAAIIVIYLNGFPYGVFKL